MSATKHVSTPIYSQIIEQIELITDKFERPPEKLLISQRHYNLLKQEILTHDEIYEELGIQTFYDVPVWVVDFFDIGWFLIEPKI